MSSFEIEIEGGPSFTVDVTAVGPQGDPGVVSVEYPLVLDDPNNTISIASGYFALQSSLANYLTISSAQSTYAPLISPFLTGIPQAPTAAQGTATQQIATTGFVDTWFAPKASPTFSGVVTVPTAAEGDNSQKAASTAFVNTALSAGLAPYLTAADAADIYQPIAGMSAYYLASNPSGFITTAALNGYATESWVEAKNYLTSANLAGYATQSWVQSQNYLTSASLSGYATQSWVTSQGYITSSALAPYLLSSTAASTYQVIGDYATNTALTNGLAGKANTVHTHDASAIVSGTIDIARIPIIPSQVQVVSTQNSIANLTPSEQAQITGAGVLVTTTDGNRWVYSGSGSKTDQASYVKVADITPDWTEISNKPAFGTAALANTGDFAPAGWNPFDQTLNKADTVDFKKVTLTFAPGTIVLDPYWLGTGITHTVGSNVVGMTGLDGFTHTDGTHTITVKSSGITFGDGTTQTTAATTPDLTPYLTKADNLASLTSASTARTNLGLGSAAVEANDYWIRSPLVAATDGQIPIWNAATGRSVWSDNQARTLYATVRNNSGVLMPKGSVVYISGGIGSHPTVTLAMADSDANSARTFGILAQDLADNADGSCIVSGYLSGVNTGSYVEGTQLYLSPTTPGGWTSTKPSAPNHLVYVGKVIRQSATVGAIEVGIQNGYELEELHDVAISGVAAGDVIYRNAGNTLWVNGTLSAAGILSTSAASSTYLTQANAASTYLTQANASSTYLTQANAATTYAALAGTNGFTGANTFTISTGTAVPLTIQNNGTGNSFVVNDQASDTTPFVINANGSVGIKMTSPNFDLDVNGTARVQSLRFLDDTVQTTAYTGSTNPFDQSLNKDESVKFNQIVAGPTVTGMPYGFIANALGFYFNDSTGGHINGTIQSDGIEVNKAGSSTWLRSGGIEFPDGSLQTTAFTGSTNPFNQSLNTTDSVVFATIDASRDVSIVKFVDGASEIPLVQVRQDQQLATLSAGNLYLYDSSFGAGTTYAYNGIFFDDGSSQNTAFVPANYLTASQVSSTYQTISGMSAYQTISGMSAYAALGSSNSFTTTQSITANSASAALTVTQTGTGNSFVVNDQAGDTTPFVINTSGLVGLNVSNPAAMLDIAHSLTSGTGIRLAVASGQSFNASAGLLYVNIQNTGATGKAFVIENRGTGDCLYIHDTAATDTTPFVVDNDGNCIIGGQTITAGYKLDVRGNAKVDAIKIGGSSNLSAVNYTTTGQPATVDRTTYPNEIQVVINGVTYAMPARQV